MDELQERLARIALARIGDRGFVLAGGSAVVAHGLSARVTEDVDLFTNRMRDSTSFRAAVASALDGWHAEGLKTRVIRDFNEFTAVEVSDEAGRASEVDMGVDYRADPPVMIASLGPVLSRDDAVAGKMLAVYGREEARDMADISDILASGHYTTTELMRIADTRQAAPLDRRMFALQLEHGARMPERNFAPYGVKGDRLQGLRDRLRSWARELHKEVDGIRSASRPPSGAPKGPARK